MSEAGGHGGVAREQQARDCGGHDQQEEYDLANSFVRQQAQQQIAQPDGKQQIEQNIRDHREGSSRGQVGIQ